VAVEFDEYVVDTMILGAGPAGMMLAALLAETYGLRVLVCDPNLEKPWPNNYGVWLEEWELIAEKTGFDLNSCLQHTWPRTQLYLAQQGDAKLELQRAYGRVDRTKLKAMLKEKCEKAGVIFLEQAVKPKFIEEVKSELCEKTSPMDTPDLKPAPPDYSRIKLKDGRAFKARMVVDCSGFNTELIDRMGKHDPGFQVSYSIEAKVRRHPYDKDAMIFMDYRTDWAAVQGPERLREAEEQPSFLYSMPMPKYNEGEAPPPEGEEDFERIFMEETSLVARPPMKPEELKRRMYERLKYMGIEILEIEDEGGCFIPMGGSLPKRNQRVLALGGAGNFVHPSTGYMVTRLFMGLTKAAKAIAREIKYPPFSPFNPVKAAQNVYAQLWTVNFRRQWDFTIFGGEFLMRQPVSILRGFFDGFFKLDTKAWSGFLAGWPGLPNNGQHASWDRRLEFGVELFMKWPNEVRLALMLGAIRYGGLNILRSITPNGFLPYSDEDIDTAYEKDVVPLRRILYGRDSIKRLEGNVRVGAIDNLDRVVSGPSGVPELDISGFKQPPGGLAGRQQAPSEEPSLLQRWTEE